MGGITVTRSISAGNILTLIGMAAGAAYTYFAYVRDVDAQIAETNKDVATIAEKVENTQTSLKEINVKLATILESVDARTNNLKTSYEYRTGKIQIELNDMQRTIAGQSAQIAAMDRNQDKLITKFDKLIEHLLASNVAR